MPNTGMVAIISDGTGTVYPSPPDQIAADDRPRTTSGPASRLDDQHRGRRANQLVQSLTVIARRSPYNYDGDLVFQLTSPIGRHGDPGSTSGAGRGTTSRSPPSATRPLIPISVGTAPFNGTFQPDQPARGLRRRAGRRPVDADHLRRRQRPATTRACSTPGRWTSPARRGASCLGADRQQDGPERQRHPGPDDRHLPGPGAAERRRWPCRRSTRRPAADRPRAERRLDLRPFDPTTGSRADLLAAATRRCSTTPVARTRRHVRPQHGPGDLGRPAPRRCSAPAARSPGRQRPGHRATITGST